MMPAEIARTPVPSPAAVRLQLLGTPQALVEGSPLPLSGAKADALLTYLALTGRPQPRERLLDLLWPDSHRAVWVDVRAFEQAAVQGEVAAAADLYAGPLLDALALADAPDLELWLRPSASGWAGGRTGGHGGAADGGGGHRQATAVAGIADVNLATLHDRYESSDGLVDRARL